MKVEQLYKELEQLAEKLGLEVLEHNFRTAGIHVKSGFCIVKEKPCCIIDKRLKLSKKTEVLAECICELPHESEFVVPVVREYLERFRPEWKIESKTDDAPSVDPAAKTQEGTHSENS